MLGYDNGVTMLTYNNDVTILSYSNDVIVLTLTSTETDKYTVLTDVSADSGPYTLSLTIKKVSADTPDSFKVVVNLFPGDGNCDQLFTSNEYTQTAELVKLCELSTFEILINFIRYSIISDLFHFHFSGHLCMRCVLQRQ